jgi:hypothetical protein
MKSAATAHMKPISVMEMKIFFQNFIDTHNAERLSAWRHKYIRNQLIKNKSCLIGANK